MSNEIAAMQVNYLKEMVDVLAKSTASAPSTYCSVSECEGSAVQGFTMAPLSFHVCQRHLNMWMRDEQAEAFNTAITESKRKAHGLLASIAGLSSAADQETVRGVLLELIDAQSAAEKQQRAHQLRWLDDAEYRGEVRDG